MAGRKPKPTNLKVLQGNAGKRKISKNEPKPRRVVPRCPPHLDAIAQKEWKRFSRVLDRLGLLTEIDGSAFAAYCDLYSRWVKINRDIEREEKRLETEKARLLATLDFGLDPDALTKLARLPASAMLVHDYSIDDNGNEHIKISQHPLIVMARQTLQLIRSFCTEFGMTPSSRGRIQINKPEEKSAEESFLEGVGKK